MFTVTAVARFGSKATIAEKLGISASAVSQWGELVPPLSAAKLAKLSREDPEGEPIEFDPDLYETWNGRRAS